MEIKIHVRILYIVFPAPISYKYCDCVEGVLRVRKKEGLKRHLNKDHGPRLDVACDDTWKIRDIS